MGDGRMRSRRRHGWPGCLLAATAALLTLPTPALAQITIPTFPTSTTTTAPTTTAPPTTQAPATTTSTAPPATPAPTTTARPAAPTSTAPTGSTARATTTAPAGATSTTGPGTTAAPRPATTAVDPTVPPARAEGSRPGPTLTLDREPSADLTWAALLSVIGFGVAVLMVATRWILTRPRPTRARRVAPATATAAAPPPVEEAPAAPPTAAPGDGPPPEAAPAPAAVLGASDHLPGGQTHPEHREPQ